MSQSLYTAMSGISAAQTDLSVISNNIANLNTTGFKSSSVNFSDVFYTTLSSGTGSTESTGGTNPMQVGLGVQVSSVSKDFSSGTWVATGNTTDMMIQGNGFFSVQSSAGEVFYTRAGNFSFDSDGDLVTTDGYKVLGTDKLLSAASSITAVHIPQKIVSDVSANDDYYTKNLTDLNNCNLTDGDFRMSVNSNSAMTLHVDTEAYDTMQELAGSLQAQITAASTAASTAATAAGTQATAATNRGSETTAAYTLDQTMTAALNTSISTSATAAVTHATAALAAGTMTQAQYDAIVAAATTATTTAAAALAAGAGNMTTAQRDAIVTAESTISTNETAVQTSQNALSDAYDGVTVLADATTDGTVQFKVDGTDARTLAFTTATSNQSNFLSETGLATAVISSNTYSSEVLDYKVDVTQVTSIDEAISRNSYSIGDDGSIEVTYSNGDTLSVEVGSDGNTYGFVYTTAENIVIHGADVNVDANVAEPANFVIQLASVTNPDGLLATGSNLFSAGPNAGDIIYSVGDAMGLGSLASGGLEASNVDLSSEFSNMILAQRAVQANSRVFTTTSDIMDVIVNMGR